MLTPEQLATIKERFEYLEANQSTTHHFCIVDYSALLAEVERLQLIEKAAEQLDVLREIKDYIGHYGEQFVLTGNPRDLK